MTDPVDALTDDDNDELNDLWELQYGLSPDIADDLHGPNGDLDGDGLTNLQEYQIGTSPVRPNSMNAGGTYKIVPIAAALANKAYDVYYRPDSNPNNKWRRISGSVPGQKTCTFVNPNPGIEGDYIFVDAADEDGDGLSNGYEQWFTYNEARTFVNLEDSDGDTLLDGWEVQYGLNPMSASPPDGALHDPDGDSLPNNSEHDSYGFLFKQFNASYDPKKNILTQASRPLITISTATAAQFNNASFTFTRYAKSGDPAPYNSDLVVYFAVGGSLVYQDDYTLSVPQGSALTDTAPPFSVTIPYGQPSIVVTIAVTPGAVPASDLTVTLVEYGSVQ